MKIASVVTAFITSLAPAAFAAEIDREPGSGIPAVKYQYGMQVDINKVLYRTDNSKKVGVVPVNVVYEDSKGEVHKIQFMEWGNGPHNV